MNDKKNRLGADPLAGLPPAARAPAPPVASSGEEGPAAGPLSGPLARLLDQYQEAPAAPEAPAGEPCVPPEPPAAAVPPAPPVPAEFAGFGEAVEDLADEPGPPAEPAAPPAGVVLATFGEVVGELAEELPAPEPAPLTALAPPAPAAPGLAWAEVARCLAEASGDLSGSPGPAWEVAADGPDLGRGTARFLARAAEALRWEAWTSKVGAGDLVFRLEALAGGRVRLWVTGPQKGLAAKHVPRAQGRDPLSALGREAAARGGSLWLLTGERASLRLTISLAD
ncbi:MAG: hypothetical protein KQJ78_16725 [Deltaproteobacteria bacterium]|nr:hypothetical protein [Deltaproteobacteria bacterium]